MEEDKNTQQELEKIIENFKKDDLSSIQIYAIRTILYDIIAVWLRFFKDKDISILFASLREKNTDDFDYIKTLLNQCKNFSVSVAYDAASSAKDVSYSETYGTKDANRYVLDSIECATYVLKYALFSIESAEDDAADAADAAKKAASSAVFFATNSNREVNIFVPKVPAELAISAESIAAYPVLFYLIIAYISIKNKKLYDHI